MERLFQGIKALVKGFFDLCSEPKCVHDQTEYVTAKKWAKAVRLLYAGFLALTIAEIILLPFALPIIDDLVPFPPFLICVLFPFYFLLVNWGYATLIVYIKTIVKSVWKTAKVGYEVGKNVQETHVEVTHEFGNTYSVSSHTHDKRFIGAYIAACAQFFLWVVFCIYIGPFLTFKKLNRTMQNIKAYENQ